MRPTLLAAAIALGAASFMPAPTAAQPNASCLAQCRADCELFVPRGSASWAYCVSVACPQLCSADADRAVPIDMGAFALEVANGEARWRDIGVEVAPSPTDADVLDSAI